MQRRLWSIKPGLSDPHSPASIPYHHCMGTVFVSWPSSSTMTAAKDRLWTLRREHVSSLYSATDTLNHLQGMVTLILAVIQSTALDSLHYSSFFPHSPFSPYKEPLEHCQCRTAAGSMQLRPPGQLLSLRSSCAHSLMETAFFLLAIHNSKHIKENQKDTGIKIASVSITRAVDTPGFWTHAKC